MTREATASFAIALRDALGGDAARDAWHLVSVEQTDSTQDDALEIANEVGSLRGRWIVVRAGQQRDGRGRGGRAWLDAPGGSLLVTIATELGAPAERWPLASLVAGAALAEELERALQTRIAMKWPNDLLMVRDGAWRKLGGCLAERRERAGLPPIWLFGFGLNLDRAAFSASIAAEIAAVRDRVDDLDPAGLLARLLRGLRTALATWRARSWRLDVDAIDARLAFVGDEITLALDDRGGTTSGRLLGLDSDGRLLVSDAAGASRAWLPLSVLDAKSTPPWHAPRPRTRT